MDNRILFCFLIRYKESWLAEYLISFQNDGSYLFLLYYNFCLWNHVKELCSRVTCEPLMGPCFLVCGCKGTTIPQTNKTITRFFRKKILAKTRYLILIYVRERSVVHWQESYLSSFFNSLRGIRKEQKAGPPELNASFLTLFCRN